MAEIDGVESINAVWISYFFLDYRYMYIYFFVTIKICTLNRVYYKHVELKLFFIGYDII